MLSFLTRIVDAVLSAVFVFVTFSFVLAVASGVTGKEYEFTDFPGVTKSLNTVKSAGREFGVKIGAWITKT